MSTQPPRKCYKFQTKRQHGNEDIFLCHSMPIPNPTQSPILPTNSLFRSDGRKSINRIQRIKSPLKPPQLRIRPLIKHLLPPGLPKICFIQIHPTPPGIRLPNSCINLSVITLWNSTISLHGAVKFQGVVTTTLKIVVRHAGFTALWV